MTIPQVPAEFTEERLRTIGPPETEPADFEKFWEATFREATQYPLDLYARRIWSPEKSIEVAEVHYTSWGGVRIGGWVARPNGSTRALVLGHGYGGRPWFELGFALAGYTTIMPCIRGFHLSSHPEIPSEASHHVLMDIDDRDKYVIRGCVADLWLAASAVLALHPDCADQLYFQGLSFSGGLGALMLPWDSRFRAAHLKVPTFGNQPIRLRTPSNGAGEPVRLYWQEHPEIARVLAYYDAATAAKRITIPTICSPALYDPVVAPAGQFAVANALPNGEIFVQPAGHFDYPEMAETAELLHKRVLEFFTQSS